MEDFVNEAHGVQLTGFNGLFRMIVEIPFGVHGKSKFMNRVKISQDHISAEGEQRFI